MLRGRRGAEDAGTMPARPFTAAAVAALFGRDLTDALTRIEDTIEHARAEGAELVVFPETTLGGYVREDQPAPGLPPSLDVEGPEVAAMIRLAGDMTVCFGLTTE